VFVDRSDIREEDSPNFYGIAPGKRVGLKYSHIINITGIEKVDGKITKVTATIDHDVIYY
jgi:glutaminyl-tRNA synthetase